MNRADERLAQRVTNALNETEPIEAVGSDIHIDAHDSVVRLSGVVRTDVHRYLAVQRAKDVHGVASVEDDLTTDSKLATDVAGAFATDPKLVRLPLLVQSNLGEITIRGRVADPALVDRALALARTVPGVTGAHFEYQLY